MNAPARPRTAHLPHGTLGYRDAGSGPAILFLHGLNGGSGSWSAQFEALSARHRVIAWDAPGYGESDLIEATGEAYADAASALLDGLGAGAAVVVGHSMGGVVAALLAHRHPASVERLVLSCTHWGSALPAAAPLGAKYLRRLQERRSLADPEYGRLKATKMLPPGASAAVAAKVASIASTVSAQGLERAIRMQHSADNRRFFPALSMPMLLIDCARDPVLKPERAAALAALLPQARRVTLDHCGHVPYLEDPAAYNRALEEFLAP